MATYRRKARNNIPAKQFTNPADPPPGLEAAGWHPPSNRFVRLTDWIVPGNPGEPAKILTDDEFQAQYERE